jgi:hypothetical protein
VVVGDAELERVRPADVAEIVLPRPPGCSVPLSAAPPQEDNSENETLPRLTLQSTALMIQTLLFQFLPTLTEKASLLKVLMPNEK